MYNKVLVDLRNNIAKPKQRVQMNKEHETVSLHC